MRRIFLLSLLLVGCGGGKAAPPVSPTTAQPPPTPTPVPVLTITAGDTGRPLSGVRVVVAGVPYLTDDAGQVRPAGATHGAMVDIIAAGYFDRQTLVREGPAALAQFTLWPRRPLPSVDEEYTRRILYTYDWTDTPDLNVPLSRLSPSVTQIRLVLSPDLFADPTSRFFHQFAADAMNTAVGGRFRYSVGEDSVAGSFNVPVSVNPGGSGCGERTLGYVSWRRNRGEITSESIVYCSTAAARRGDTVVHEAGHTVGLNHSALSSDVMYAFANGADVFRDRELLTMKLMYQRPGGNTFPDNDRDTLGLSSTDEEIVICGR